MDKKRIVRWWPRLVAVVMVCCAIAALCVVATRHIRGSWPDPPRPDYSTGLFLPSGTYVKVGIYVFPTTENTVRASSRFCAAVPVRTGALASAPSPESQAAPQVERDCTPWSGDWDLFMFAWIRTYGKLVCRRRGSDVDLLFSVYASNAVGANEIKAALEAVADETYARGEGSLKICAQAREPAFGPDGTPSAREAMILDEEYLDGLPGWPASAPVHSPVPESRPTPDSSMD